MYKYLLVLPLFILLITKGYGQKTKAAGFIVRSSFNVGTATSEVNNNSSKLKNRIGYGVSLDYLKVISKNEHFFVSAMGAFNSRGYKDVRVMYLDVPITINYAFGKRKRLYIGAGMYGGLALTGSYKVTNGRTKINFGEDIADNRSRTDYGYIIRYTDFTPYGIIFNIDFYGGLKNVIPNNRQSNNSSLKTRTTVVSLGIPLKKLK